MKSFIYNNKYTWVVALFIPLAFVSLLFFVPSLYYGDYIYHMISPDHKPEKFDVPSINLVVFLWIFSFVSVSVLLTVIWLIYRDKIGKIFQYDLMPVSRSLAGIILFVVSSYFIFHQVYILPPKMEHLFHQGMLFFYVSGALAGFFFTASNRGAFILFRIICVWVLLISMVTMFTSKLLPLVTFLCLILFGSLLKTPRITSFKFQCLAALVIASSIILLTTKYIVRKDCYLDRPFERILITANMDQILTPLVNITACAQTLSEIRIRERVRTDLTISINNDFESKLNHNLELDNQSASTELFLERIVRRVSHLKYLGRVMHEVTSKQDSVGYSHYGKILNALVPRFLWPNKPRFINSNEFGRKFQFINQTDFVTSVNLDVITEAWIVDRWWGVVCSATIVSALVFLIWFGSTFFASSVIKIAVLSLIPINTFALESGLGAFSLGIIQQLFVLGLTITLLLRFKLLKHSSLDM